MTQAKPKGPYHKDTTIPTALIDELLQNCPERPTQDDLFGGWSHRLARSHRNGVSPHPGASVHGPHVAQFPQVRQFQTETRRLPET